MSHRLNIVILLLAVVALVASGCDSGAPVPPSDRSSEIESYLPASLDELVSIDIDIDGYRGTVDDPETIQEFAGVIREADFEAEKVVDNSWSWGETMTLHFGDDRSLTVYVVSDTHWGFDAMKDGSTFVVELDSDVLEPVIRPYRASLAESAEKKVEAWATLGFEDGKPSLIVTQFQGERREWVDAELSAEIGRVADAAMELSSWRIEGELGTHAPDWIQVWDGEGNVRRFCVEASGNWITYGVYDRDPWSYELRSAALRQMADRLREMG